MRKLLVAAVALGVIVWSGAAWAIVVDTTPKTPAGPETPGTNVHIITKDDKGQTIKTHTVQVDKGGHAKVDIPDEEKKKAKTVVITSVDKGKVYRTEVGIDVFMQGGDIALTAVGAALRQVSVAEHNPAPQPMPMTVPLRMVDTSFFQFGFGVGENWTKTSANDFGTGLGGSTIFDHTFSDTVFNINAGYFVPVFPGVAFGGVVSVVSGDMGGGNGVSLTTPSGTVGTSLVRRDYGIDAMGRLYINSVWTPYGLNMFVEGGAEFADYHASMVNSGVETFQSSTHTTSGIVGGGFQIPICGPFGIPSDGVCSLQLVAQYDHVFVNTSFFTGMTALSSATAQVKGEDRVMGGLNFVVPTGNRPNAGRFFANWGF